MKPKKTKKANLENFRTIFLQIGMTLSLTAILFAFEWKTAVNIEEISAPNTNWEDVEDLPPVTMPKAEIKEVKPPSFELEVVDDIKDFKIEDDLHELFKGLEDYQPEDFSNIVKDVEVVDDEPLVIAEFMPTFQGKDLRYFRNYVSANLKFPERAVETGINGTVYIEFVVDKDGSVSDVRILRGVHPDVDAVVLQVIKNSPKWEPGFNNGIYVRVKFTMPIAFKLL
jgi:protein TonB